MSQGVFITKPGYNVLTDNDPSHFYFRSDRNTFKFVTILPISISVTDDDGPTPHTILTQTANLPANINFHPFYFTYLGTHLGINQFNYGEVDNGTGYAGRVYVVGNPANQTLQMVLDYSSGGSTSFTYTAYVYLFGNDIS